MPGLPPLWPTLLALLVFGGTASAQDKVVYHIDDATTQATKGLRNIRNHLDIAPDTRIVVVRMATASTSFSKVRKMPKTAASTSALSSVPSRRAA